MSKIKKKKMPLGGLLEPILQESGKGIDTERNSNQDAPPEEG